MHIWMNLTDSNGVLLERVKVESMEHRPEKDEISLAKYLLKRVGHLFEVGE